jgi:transposase-like protein
MEKQYCPKCHSFDVQITQSIALDGRPTFKCGSCRNIWMYGKTGEPYYTYCLKRMKR